MMVGVTRATILAHSLSARWNRRAVLTAVATGLVSGSSGCADAAASTVRLSSAKGADASGRTDSSQAVQRFVDRNRGKRILVDGTFRMDGPLLLPSGSELAGEVQNHGFRFTWSASNHGGHYIGNVDPDRGNHNIRLTGFTILGAGTGLPAGSAAGSLALSFRRGTGLVLQHLRVLNSPSIAIAYQGVQRVRITDNVIDGSGRDGITGWWYTSPLHDVTVARNRISRMGDDAIAINASAPENPNHTARPSRITIEDNVIVGHNQWHPDLWGRGILILGAENVVVRGNRISRAAAAGILISADEQSKSARYTSRNITVHGNVIERTGAVSRLTTQPRSGMFVTSASEVVVDRNTVTGSFEQGLLLSDVHDVAVTGNIVSQNGTACTRDVADSGITATSSSQLRISDNTMQANASNGLHVQSVNGAVISNNRCSDNGRKGDSRTPPSAGIWVQDSSPVRIVGNRCTQGDSAGTAGRQSWGIIAPGLSTESSAEARTNHSTGAVIGQIYTGQGAQASLDLWRPAT